MKLIVLTPEKEVYKGDIQSVKVPGTKGQFEILKGHAPIVSSLSEGTVSIVADNGEKQFFNIKKGFLEVLNNDVSLLVQVVSE